MELWTAEHAKTLLPALAVMLVLAWVLQRVIGKKSHKIRMLPIQIIACLLVLLEIGKQAVSLAHGYDLYHLPFHFCSLFIFMLPIMAFYKGKHKQTVYAITASLCMAVCLLMLIYPALIYSDGNIREFFTNYISFHTVAFHNLVMLSAILIPVLKVHEPAKKGEGKAITLFMLCFCTVSAVMAQLLKTNFNNFYRCNIPPLETVRQIVENAWGSVPAMLLYVLIVTILDILFVLGAYRLYLLMRHISQKEKAYTK